VAAYDNAVSVVGVGFDIACGNAAIRTDATLDDLGRKPGLAQKELSHLADRIANTVSFGIGRKNRADDAPTDDPLFEDAAWEAVPAKRRQALHTKARQQLGTVGRGNHYVDVVADETGALWGLRRTAGLGPRAQAQEALPRPPCEVVTGCAMATWRVRSYWRRCQTRSPGSRDRSSCALRPSRRSSRSAFR
ncbi:MAG TPA: RtcB family protein, partial [Gemmatimonadales bacterium]|nr:RtcB family protein [Gemmatimonadales bacterium]